LAEDLQRANDRNTAFEATTQVVLAEMGLWYNVYAKPPGRVTVCIQPRGQRRL